LFVYILEAHASDEWPLGKERSCFEQHKTVEARRQAAQAFRAKRMSAALQSADPLVQLAAQVPFAVDTMDNKVHATFGAWPEVYLVVADGKLVKRTEAMDGLGTIQGGPWDVVVRRTLVNFLGESVAASS
jgi:hypothetical protein